MFDLSKPFGYAEAFITIGVVCFIAFVCFLVLKNMSKKNQK